MPTQRRQWDSLTPAYRRRLERGGITRSAYESGVPVTAARGHKGTPERPGRALRSEAARRKYAQYNARRTRRPGLDVVTRAELLGLQDVFPWVVVLDPDDLRFVARNYLAYFMRTGKASDAEIHGRERFVRVEIPRLAREYHTRLILMDRENWKEFKHQYMSHFGG